MKEKLKQFGKWFLIMTVLFLVLHEFYGLTIDIYNFRQLEKVKVILKDLKRTDKKFLDLKDFNKIYNANIQPIKNCYYLRNYSTEDRVPYLFGFKLESYIYIYIYQTQYYAYPKYDIPYGQLCT